MTLAETTEFLRCVLPAEGAYCYSVFINGTGKPLQFFCETIEDLAGSIRSQDQIGRTVYHACATFKVAGRRTQTNAQLARALWFDLDCGDGKPFADKAIAARAVLAFCGTHGLPRPIFVDSGRGVHCYWALEQELEPATWLQYAAGLKATALASGLAIDPARTADVASILRTPGTHNRKDGERLVRYDPASLVRHPIGLFEKVRISETPRAPNPRSRSGPIVARIDAGNTFGEVYSDDVAERCQQVNALRRSGNLPEPLWFAIIGVLAFCADGEVKAHEWSRQDYPGYVHADVADRLVRTRALTGATTCAKFQGLNPAGCNGCPLLGKINSPVSVPVKVVPSEPVEPVDEHKQIIVGNETLPKPPDQFEWSEKNELVFRQEDAKGNIIDLLVCKNPVYLDGVQTNELDARTFSYRFKRFLPMEGWGDVLIDAKALHGNGGIAEMFGKGTVVHDSKYFLMYARHAVDTFHAEEETRVRFDQYGWKNNNTAFFYWDYLYTAAGPLRAIGAKEVDTRAQWIGPRGGSLEEWGEAVNFLFAANMEAYAAIVLASFAAVLMKFLSPEEGGAIIHLFTPGSGKGKTTALQAAWSVWGRRQGLSITNDDTKVAKPIAIGALANLPVIYDEIHERDPDVMRKFVVMFTEGRDRMRGTIDGTIRHTKTNWQTILLSGSNNSLVDPLQGHDTDAPAFRILELVATLPLGLDKAKGERMKRVLDDNSGHAGDAFLRYLVQPEVLAWTKNALDKWTQEIWDITKLESPHRFRIRAVGAIAVAAKLVKHVGIIDFNTDRIIGWLVKQLMSKENEGTISAVTSLENSMAAFGEFINTHVGEMLIVPDRFKKGTMMVPITKPYNKISMRYEIGPNRLFISRQAFNDWCIVNQRSPRHIIASLGENTVLLDAKRPMTLSAGTNIPGVQIECIEANTAHPAMSGIVAAVTELQDPEPDPKVSVLPSR